MAKFTCRDCTRFLLLEKECQKKIPERSNGWLVVSVSSNSAFTARTAESCKKSKYYQNFVNCNIKCSGLRKGKACISSNCSSTYSGPKSPHLEAKQ